MNIDLGLGMVRKRVLEAEEADDARILKLRKKRREELLAEARRSPKPPCFIVTWFRGGRTIAAF